jgi:DNA-binding NarL/FixJ family response regulator
MIRIVIICEHEQDIKTICALLTPQNDFMIAGIGSSGYDALKFAADLRPDIIIMDMWMTDIYGMDLAPIIKRQSPMTGIIALSSGDKANPVNQALRAGISGFLLKRPDMAELAGAVRTVHQGGYYFSAPVKNQAFIPDAAVKAAQYPQACFALSNISPTERKIINYLASGYSVKEIADDLHITAGTIRNSMTALVHRAGLKNRIHVVACAVSFGLITESL